MAVDKATYFRSRVLLMASKALCTDGLKYALSNAIRKPVDERMFARKRALLYSSLYNIYDQNRNSKIKAPHLYSLLYSKYYTERFILRAQGKENDYSLEDDEALKQKFAEMMATPDISSKAEFRHRYLAIIKKLKEERGGGGAVTVQEYEALDDQICNSGNRKMLTMDGDTQELFSIGSAETNEYLEGKLGEDLALFEAPPTRFFNVFRNYHFLAGWITAGGLWAFGLVFGFAKVSALLKP